MEKKLDVRKNEKGASMLEYALLAALIAVIAVTTLGLLGREVDNTFTGIEAELQNANIASGQGAAN